MLWELSAEDLLRTELPGIWALLPLARDGKKTEVIEEMIRQLHERGRHEVLSIGYVLASHVWTSESKQQWLRRRFEMLCDELRNTWAYKEFWQEGREEGLELGLQRGILQSLQQGRTEGIQEGKVIALRETLLTIVENDFPNLQRLAQSVLAEIMSLAELQQLLLKLRHTQTFEEVRTALLEAMKENKKLIPAVR
ncbi:MAG: hypothetical protein M3Z08_09800 [Chloroflexota bacterium]|nr:hypothetical protein [Chloroflexota bacterium]